MVATAQQSARRVHCGTVSIPKEITLGVGGMAFMDNNTLLICTREGGVEIQHKTAGGNCTPTACTKVWAYGLTGKRATST